MSVNRMKWIKAGRRLTWWLCSKDECYHRLQDGTRHRGSMDVLLTREIWRQTWNTWVWRHVFGSLCFMVQDSVDNRKAIYLFAKYNPGQIFHYQISTFLRNKRPREVLQVICLHAEPIRENDKSHQITAAKLSLVWGPLPGDVVRTRTAASAHWRSLALQGAGVTCEVHVCVHVCVCVCVCVCVRLCA